MGTYEGWNFDDYRGLSEVVIEEGVKTIGEVAFVDVLRLQKIDLPNSVTTIGKSAFSYSGLETIVIPNSV